MGKRVKVIPILHKNCDIPYFLKDKLYADFTHSFDDGLNKLLSRLRNNPHGNKNKKLQVFEILEKAFEDWRNFDERDALLLNHKMINMIFENTSDIKLPKELVIYILASLAMNGQFDKTKIKRIQEWLVDLGEKTIREIFSIALQNKYPKIRRGIPAMIESLGKSELLLDLIADCLLSEDDLLVQREYVRLLNNWSYKIRRQDAYTLMKTDDWILCGYAFKILQKKACLLISDDTEFAQTMNSISKKSGFETKLIPVSQYWETSDIDDALLNTYDIIILVRGNHFAEGGDMDFYRKLRKYVANGGTLLATAFVVWETEFENEFSDLLPFALRSGGFDYNENKTITCQPTQHPLPQEIFPNQFTFQSSFENLITKDGAITILETTQGIPIIGHRHFELGTCYYFNTCQHYCYGNMISPLSNNQLFHGFISVMKKIYNDSIKVSDQ